MKNPIRGSKVLIKSTATVPYQFRGQRGFILKTNYSSEKGYLYKIQIGETFEPDKIVSSITVNDDDILFLND